MTPEQPPSHEHQESSPSKEAIFLFHTGVIVVSGYPGTGKSRTIRMLAEKYGIPPPRTIKVGANFRRKMLAAYGEQVLDFVERPVEEDQLIDKVQLKLLESANPQFPILLESKLGGFLAYKLKERYIAEGKTPPPICTILFYGEEEELKRRVWRRERKKHPGLTREECDVKTERRQQLDGQQWGNAHPEYPELQMIDPLKQGNRGMYDMALDTTYLKPAQVAEQIHSLLLQHGCIEEVIAEQERPSLPPSGTIFEAP